MIGSEIAASKVPKTKLEAKLKQVKTKKWPDNIKRAKKEAIAVFEQIGFPNTKLEEFKYTDLNHLTRHDYEIAKQRKIRKINSSLFALDANRIVTVNGYLDEEFSRYEKELVVKPLSNTPKIKIKSLTSLSKLEKLSDGLTALNTGYFSDGLYLEIKGKNKKPILLLNFVDDSAANVFCQPRFLVEVLDNSKVDVIQANISAGKNLSWTNQITEVFVGKNSDINLFQIQDDHGQGFLTQRTEIYQSKKSQVNCFTISLNGAFIRNDLHSFLDGEQAKLNLFGLYLPKDRQFIDNHTKIEHNVANCTSQQLYKGVLNDSSTAVFNGKIYIHPKAQNSQADQLNKNVLLSDNATIHTKPELEIFADQVKCTHGATTGALDPEALFYLEARGVNSEKAKELLLQGFINEVLQHINNKEIQTFLSKEITKS